MGYFKLMIQLSDFGGLACCLFLQRVDLGFVVVEETFKCCGLFEVCFKGRVGVDKRSVFLFQILETTTELGASEDWGSNSRVIPFGDWRSPRASSGTFRSHFRFSVIFLQYVGACVYRLDGFLSREEKRTRPTDLSTSQLPQLRLCTVQSAMCQNYAMNT